MKFNIKITLILLSFFVFLSFPFPSAFAAEVYISTPDGIHVGDTFEVLITIDTAGALINSTSAVLEYDQDEVSFAGYQTENTVMTLWLDAPQAKDGRVSFSGIVPGGVAGIYDPDKVELAEIPLTRLLFTAEKAGQAEFSFLDSVLLQHDGRGTPLAHTRVGGSISITGELDGDIDRAHPDKTAPEPFQITVIDASLFSKTPPMVIFVTEDRDSGIKEYRMHFPGLGWRIVESPVPISKSIFPKKVTIRAFDFAGNFQEESITLLGILPPQVLYILVALAFFILCLSCAKMIKYKT